MVNIDLSVITPSLNLNKTTSVVLCTQLQTQKRHVETIYEWLVYAPLFLKHLDNGKIINRY